MSIIGAVANGILKFIMFSFEIIILAIGLVIAIGRFLDGDYFQNPIKEHLRTGLIKFYFFLYEFPGRARKVLSSIADRAYEDDGSSLLWTRTFGRVYWLIFVPAFSIGFAYLGQYVYKEDMLGVTKVEAWWFAWVVGVAIGATLPLILLTLIALIALFLTFPCLVALAVTESTRRGMLLILNQATHPKTSPFSYFAALLAVVLAGSAILNRMLN